MSLRGLKERKQMTMLPEIGVYRRKGGEEELPKKSLKMKKIETSPA